MSAVDMTPSPGETTYLAGLDWHRTGAPRGRWATFAVTAAGIGAAAEILTERPRAWLHGRR